MWLLFGYYARYITIFEHVECIRGSVCEPWIVARLQLSLKCWYWVVFARANHGVFCSTLDLSTVDAKLKNPQAENEAVVVCKEFLNLIFHNSFTAWYMLSSRISCIFKRLVHKTGDDFNNETLPFDRFKLVFEMKKLSATHFCKAQKHIHSMHYFQRIPHLRPAGIFSPRHVNMWTVGHVCRAVKCFLNSKPKSEQTIMKNSRSYPQLCEAMHNCVADFMHVTPFCATESIYNSFASLRDADRG